MPLFSVCLTNTLNVEVKWLLRLLRIHEFLFRISVHRTVIQTEAFIVKQTKKQMMEASYSTIRHTDELNACPYFHNYLISYNSSRFHRLAPLACTDSELTLKLWSFDWTPLTRDRCVPWTLPMHEAVNRRWRHTRVYPKVSGLAAWSENCKWYSSLPLDVVVSLFCESV
jgi:hypothetical protein